MDEAKIVIITGGSFNGKSTIAIQVAAHLGFSGVIPIDSIRNTLKIIYPKREYFSTSIYLLPREQIYKKIKDVSDLVKNMISIYNNRGEHVIFEGIHWSENIFRWIANFNFCKICLINKLPLKKRIILKHNTRSKLRYQDLKTGEQYLGNINISNVHNSMYMKKEDRINELQDFLISNAKNNNFKIIEFIDISSAIQESINWIQNWYKK